jgi:phytoene desaturase
MESNAQKNIAVIGGGLGGLSAAIHLAARGYPVDLFEQNSHTGGKAGTLKRNGFRFDTGPSLLTMPFVLEELYAHAGEKLSDHLRLKPLPEHCSYHYTDGSELKAHQNITEFAQEIQNKTRDSGQALHRYLAYSRKIYDFAAELFLFHDFHDKNTFIEHGSLSHLWQLPRLDPLRTVHKANAAHFKDPRLVQLFDRYATYNGSSPYRAPATLNIIPHVEYNIGSFYVEGGVRQIPEELTRLAHKLGVRLHTGHKVQKILHQDKKITGIQLQKDSFSAPIVVANSDVFATYQELLPELDSREAKRYRKLQPSSSALIFYWGIDGSTPLGIHNILFSADYPREFHHLFDKPDPFSDPTVYIYISSKYQPQDAPPNKENWFVMINAPRHRGQDWSEIAHRLRPAILTKIETMLGISISDKILSEDIATPKTLQQNTGSFGGSIYGISSNSKSAAFLRQGNRSRSLFGLYFAGGSAHPGGGMPLVMLSGKIAAEQIARYEAR